MSVKPEMARELLFQVYFVVGATGLEPVTSAV
jgi:hypothetical protein